MGMLMRRRIHEMQVSKPQEVEKKEQTEEKEQIDLEPEDKKEQSLHNHLYNYEELSGMTVKQIKEIAEEKGYVITKIIKDDVITEFLYQQQK